MQVESWLQRAATTVPTVTALEGPEGERSYAQLLSAALTGAGELLERGVRPGERVAIALPPSIAFAQALHACFLLGAVAVPVDPRLSAPERELLAAGATVLVEEPLDERPASDDLWTDLSLSLSHDLDSVAVVVHTSGTTSAPRPVELTYGNLLWSALGSSVALGSDPHERWLCTLPTSHVGGLSILVRSAIYSTTAVIHDRFRTDRVLAALRGERITLVSLVSTTLTRLLDAGLEDPPDLRCALTGGGPVPAALTRRAHQAGVPVRETYGLTECCSQAATAPARTDRLGVATPLFCTRVRIAADDEILLSGPTVARCSLSEDGWLHTGDEGRLDEDGFLRVTGRKADTIVTGGENVSPAEVEAVLEAHPQVLEAAVVGREDPHWGESITAIVVMGPGTSLDEASLREHCAAALAPYKVPKRFEPVSDPLPRTASGKLLRRELR